MHNYPSLDFSREFCKPERFLQRHRTTIYRLQIIQALLVLLGIKVACAAGRTVMSVSTQLRLSESRTLEIVVC
jgi:hypothetical protein